ncbi:AAA family ATPase [Flavobacteriales bacterium]|nr:AAA family ATPase [Flavobacteriales bacterium]
MAKGCIFIVGYMGAGKSTGGNRLAKNMGLPFVDTDAVLTTSFGREVSDLFKDWGEEGFRKAERQALRQLALEGKRRVIATGGGTPCYADNMKFMLEQGTVVYFELDPEALIQRLMTKRKNRPMLDGLSDAALPEFIQSHLEARRPYYSQAHISVDADALDESRLALVGRMISSREDFSL